ncbi:hypothetical protein ACWCPT_12480 [Streptomyces sp. NPDC002308]
MRNRDVDLAYLAIALWRVFPIAVLLPCLALNAALVLRDAHWALGNRTGTDTSPERRLCCSR